MKQKRYSDEQIAFALRQAESGTEVAEICRKLGVSEPTFYRWKKQFAGMGVVEIRRLKQLEEENAKLKRLVADLSLDKTMLQDVLRRNGEARAPSRCGGCAAGHLRHQRASGLFSHGLSPFIAALPLQKRPAGRAADAAARPGGGSSALRLPAAARAAAARRLASKP